MCNETDEEILDDDVQSDEENFDDKIQTFELKVRKNQTHSDSWQSMTFILLFQDEGKTDEFLSPTLERSTCKVHFGSKLMKGILEVVIDRLIAYLKYRIYELTTRRPTYFGCFNCRDNRRSEKKRGISWRRAVLCRDTRSVS